jgi:hypothetical protein
MILKLTTVLLFAALSLSLPDSSHAYEDCAVVYNYLANLTSALNDPDGLETLSTTLRVSSWRAEYGAQALFSAYFKKESGSTSFVNKLAYTASQCPTQFSLMINNFLVRNGLSLAAVELPNNRSCFVGKTEIKWRDDANETSISWTEQGVSKPIKVL